MGKKVFPYIIALAALAVSASAAFYSVSGLMKLFAGAAFAVGIMAGSLEVSKLVIASLLYQYWDSLNKVLRTYLTIAAFILILVTSAGIYGFLSAAYQETANQDQITTQQITALETKKKLFEQTRESLLKEKQGLSELRGTLSKASTTQFTDRQGNLVVRSNKASYKEIERAAQADDKLSGKLDIVNDSIFNLENKILQVKTNATASSELGPLKYLSGLTGYPMDKIINWFLLIIIFVFDPLAIALVIAANFAFKHKELPEDEEIDIPEKDWLEDWDTTIADGLDDLDEEPNEDLKQAVEEYKETLKQQPKQTDWEIQDEEQQPAEPYEVYTGPQEPELTPMEKEIQSIESDKHLSAWGKRSKIEEIKNRYRKEGDGKRYW